MNQNLIAKIISIILIVILCVGIICLSFLPNLYDIFKDKSVDCFNTHNFIYKFAFYLCYIICLGITYKLVNLFTIIYKGNPFRIEIEKSLRIMTVLFMLLFLIVIIKTIFIPTLLSFVVAILSFLMSLSFYILAEVIKVAREYKSELEFTI